MEMVWRAATTMAAAARVFSLRRECKFTGGRWEADPGRVFRVKERKKERGRKLGSRKRVTVSLRPIVRDRGGKHRGETRHRGW